MIFIDASENRTNTTMPHIHDSVEVANLEEVTGADMMVSNVKMPVTNEFLIKKHVENGALLIQRKHGHDLSSSIGQRMNSSLAKMQICGAKQSQCILLFIGILTINEYGEAVINRQTTRQKFWVVQAAISKWHDRGGVFENLARKSMIEQWMKMKLKHLKEYSANPTKEVWKKSPDIQVVDELLQVLMPVNDARNTLASLPGIGPKTAQTLFNVFEGNVAEAICWLTNVSKEKQKIAGIGKKTTENIREWLGLEKANWINLDIIKE